MNWIKSTYQTIADHATKALGIVGTGLMSTLAFLDPAWLRVEIQTYLGDHAAEKAGAALFALVILRGWYTGRKGKQVSPVLPPPASEATR